MNKSIKRGVAIVLLLFTFVMTNEEQIDNQSESIYEPQTEEFEKKLEYHVYTIKRR